MMMVMMVMVITMMMVMVVMVITTMMVMVMVILSHLKTVGTSLLFSHFKSVSVERLSVRDRGLS